MTHTERYDAALRELEAILENASDEHLLMAAKLMAVENAAYRNAFGTPPAPPVLPLLLGKAEEHEAALLADGVQHLASLMRLLSAQA